MQANFFFRACLALVLCVVALPAAAILGEDIAFDPSTPIQMVYRVEFVAPDDAFTRGFTAAGVDESLLSLTSGAPCFAQSSLLGPGWVATTANPAQALRFARRALEGRAQSGRNHPVHVFAIRADQEYFSVPGAFYSAIDAGNEYRQGYSPDHATALQYLLYTRPILGEQTVVVSRVNPHNILRATALWLENGALVESNETFVNTGYMPDPTSAATIRAHNWILPRMFPPHAILQSQGAANGTCAMSCDRARSASSFSASSALDYNKQCSVSDALSPMMLDMIIDGD